MAEKITLGRGTEGEKNPKWIKATFPEKSLRLMLANMDEFNGAKFCKVNINIYPLEDTKPDKYNKRKNVEVTLDLWTPQGDKELKQPTDEPIPVEYHAEQVKNANDNSQTPDNSLPF